ncbi:MAG: Gfo/Idh/MocA family oxidoreductase [Akkermansiaceae bacterium]|nr:Gfo/Idh/MocA family oxidoreductase [Akkermansiaceae bacterium]NNM28310.1 Gfo/Idh/MocA family oxidoreductase [Akkermansiaceae bacterium]
MSESQYDASRRKFIRTTGVVAASLPVAGYAQVAGSSELKVALIGCGGRGSGAASQTLMNDGVKLVAMADAFMDRIDGAHKTLKTKYKEKVDVPESRRFAGFDAYQKAMAEADVVILTTPPGFRPEHFEYAVAHGKHVFMEKPVATDAGGIRRVLAAAKEADAKKLKVVCGLQRRYDATYRAVHEQVMNGKIGDVISAQVYWNGGGVWTRPRQTGQTEMEYQMRNWYYFNWLCGDHICEQHVHNIDIANWFMGDKPALAQGMGGRQVRIGPEWGEIFDHHYVEFKYGNGGYTNSQCRHQKGCMNRVTEQIIGTKGRTEPGRGIITDLDGKVIFKHEVRKKDRRNPYEFEHEELYRHIRNDIPLNNAYYTANSTMSSILGRMATYSGKELKWDEAINSQVSIMPEKYGWDADPGPKPGPDGLYPCPVPGVTKVV